MSNKYCILNMHHFIIYLICIGIIVSVASCSGSGDGNSTPNISGLYCSPSSILVGSGEGLEKVNFSFNFSDTDGNISTLTINVFDSSHNVLFSNTDFIEGISGVKSGSIRGGIYAETSVQGEYTFELNITDKANSKSNILTAKINIYSGTAPTISNLSHFHPVAENLVLTLATSASDDDGNIKSISAAIYDSDNNQLDIETKIIEDKSGWTNFYIREDLDFGVIPVGEYTLKAYVTDGAGLTSNVLTDKIIIHSGTAPAISNLTYSFTDGEASSILVSIEALDDDKNISTITAAIYDSEYNQIDIINKPTDIKYGIVSTKITGEFDFNIPFTEEYILEVYVTDAFKLKSNTITSAVLPIIYVGQAIDAFVIDNESNKLYAIDSIDKKLIIFDLATNNMEDLYDLPYEPSRLCIDTSRDRLFITNIQNAFISEFRLADMTKVADIPWSADDWGSDYTHFHIQCDADYIYVTDANWAPNLIKIDRTFPYNETVISTIEGVGDFFLSSDGGIYIWYQYGWSAGYAGSRIERYDNEGSEYALIDATILGYPILMRDPLDSPIFFDATRKMVVNKRIIFNSENLEETIYDFGEDVVFYAADFTNGYIATKDKIYDLDTYEPIVINLAFKYVH